MVTEKIVVFSFIFLLGIGLACNASASELGVKFQGRLIEYEPRLGGGSFIIEITKILDDPGQLLRTGGNVEIVYRAGLPPLYQQNFEIDPNLNEGDSVIVYCMASGDNFVLLDGNYIKILAKSRPSPSYDSSSKSNLIRQLKITKPSISDSTSGFKSDIINSMKTNKSGMPSISEYPTISKSNLINQYRK